MGLSWIAYVGGSQFCPMTQTMPFGHPLHPPYRGALAHRDRSHGDVVLADRWGLEAAGWPPPPIDSLGVSREDDRNHPEYSRSSSGAPVGRESPWPEPDRRTPDPNLQSPCWTLRFNGPAHTAQPQVGKIGWLPGD